LGFFYFTVSLTNIFTSFILQQMRPLQLTILFLSLFVFISTINTSAVYSQEEISPSPTPTKTKESTPSAIVKYDLAYPGMLPDNPLYKLKVLRDKIALQLISDHQKKVDFYLLQTDKGILASAMLVDKGNIDLAAETALKAEHNYTLLTQELYRLQEKPEENTFDKLQKASLKHQEVIASLVKRVPQDKQKTFVTVNDFSKRNWKAVEEYKQIQEELEAESENSDNSDN